MADTTLDPRIIPATDRGGRLTAAPPGQAGNVVQAAAIAAESPSAKNYSGNYNQTIGQVAEAIKYTGIVVGAGSSASSQALQIEYSQRANANGQAIQNQVGSVQQNANQYSSSFSVGAIVSNLNTQLSQAANQMASINAAASTVQSNLSNINTAIAADNVAKLSRDSATRAAANADLKVQFANLQSQQALMTQLADSASQVQSVANDAIASRNSIAQSMGTTPEQLNSVVSQAMSQTSSNLNQSIGELNQRVNNAVNDQNQYLKNQMIASYGQQSGAALQTIALGMGDIAAGNLWSGAGQIGSAAIDFSPSFDTSLIPFSSAIKAGITGLADGIQGGNPNAALISWGNSMGGLMQFDRANQAINSFDSFAAKGDVLGMAGSTFSMLGNGALGVQQIFSNFSGAVPGYGQIFDLAAKGSAELSNGVGATLLNARTGADPLAQAAAAAYNTTFGALNSLSGGLVEQVSAIGNSINHFFEGTLGNPGNKPVAYEIRDLFNPGGVFDPGPGVRVDDVMGYQTGLGRSMLFGDVTSNALGFRGLDASLRTDGIANGTTNISQSFFNGQPNINLPLRMDVAVGLRPFGNDGMSIFGGNPFEGSNNPGSPDLGGIGFGSYGAADLGVGMLPYNPNDLYNPENPNSPFNSDNPLNPANDAFGFGDDSGFGPNGEYKGYNFGGDDGLGECVTGCWGPTPGNQTFDPDPYKTGMRGEEPPTMSQAAEEPPKPPKPPKPDDNDGNGDCCHGSWCDADCYDYDVSLPPAQPGTPGSNQPPPPPAPPIQVNPPPPSPPPSNPNTPTDSNDAMDKVAEAAGRGDSPYSMLQNALQM
jgi:hypothetical protein